MKIMSVLVCVFMMLVGQQGVGAAAKKNSLRGAKIENLVEQYYSQQGFMASNLSLFSEVEKVNPHCAPQGPACMQVACDLVGSMECDDMDEIQAISKMCRGNYSGECIAASCSRLRSMDCDDMSEVAFIARACVGHFDGDCLNFVCAKLGSMDCNDPSEIEAVLKMCAGN